MKTLPISQLPLIPPEEAGSDLTEIFDEIRRTTETPVVFNMWQTLANSAPVLMGSWQLMCNAYLQGSLPMSLKAMILFAIASAHQWRYCAAVHEATCRVIGIDTASLEAIVQDLGRLNPERARKIIKFAIKCADSPRGLEEADYEQIRAYGITDGEITEIIALAGLANYFETLADALKLEVDPFLQGLLPGGQLGH
jgi:AhpD family alkylhydroperoxidase